MSEEKLYGKYIIKKADGSEIDPEAKYFVLRYDYKSSDAMARRCLYSYACLTEFHELIADIRSEADKLEEKEAHE